MNLKQWLADRKLRRDDKRFRKGFNWAAGELLWGTAPRLIEILASEQPVDNFDRGVFCALKKWHELSRTSTL